MRINRRQFGAGVTSMAVAPLLVDLGIGVSLPFGFCLDHIRHIIAKYGLTDWTEAEIQMLGRDVSKTFDVLKYTGSPDFAAAWYKMQEKRILELLDDYLHCCVDPEFYRKTCHYEDDFERRPYKKRLSGSSSNG